MRLRALVAARPDAWSWQRAGGPEQPMNDAVQRWLAQLDEATRARWQPEPATPAGNGATTLRLLRDGRLHTTVRIETGGVQLAPLVADSAPAPTLRAGMPAADAAALKAALEQLTP